MPSSRARGRLSSQPRERTRGVSAAPALPREADRLRRDRRLLLILLPLLALAVLAAHWPALSATAVSFDDSFYLTENYVVQHPSWANAWRFLGEVLEPSTVGGYYQPLTMISLMLDCAAGGTPEYLRPFHRTSLALHVANTVLIAIVLYLILRRVGPAILVALLFGVHPLTVEPIPWLGERKTVLAAFFALLSIVCYLRYARTDRRRWYVAALACFVPALLSKPTTTPLPLALLLMDCWPLGRLMKSASAGGPSDARRTGRWSGFIARLNWPVLYEKIPFLIFSVISGVITFISQARTASVTLPGDKASPLQVPLRVAHNVMFYPFKALWPADLSSHYPLPSPLSLANPAIFVAAIACILLLALLLLSLRRTPAPLTGWLIYFVMLLPTMQVVGFTNVIASDKYAYLPVIGLLLVLAWALDRLWSRPLRFPAGGAPALLVALALLVAGLEAWRTRSYLAYWQDTEKLDKYMLALAPNAPSLRLALGSHYASKQRYDEALAQLQACLETHPEDLGALANMGGVLMAMNRYPEAREVLRRAMDLNRRESFALFNNTGLAELQLGNPQAAIPLFERAARRNPDAPRVRYNLGRALLSTGRPAEAVTQLRESVRLKPEFAEAHVSLGDALAAVGQSAPALAEYELALQLHPGLPEAMGGRISELLNQGRVQEAFDRATEAVRLQPDSASAHYNLGRCFSRLGKVNEKAAEFKQATKLNPNMPEAHNNLAAAFVALGRYPEARQHFELAVMLKPDYADARYNLAALLDALGETTRAQEQYREVLRLEPDNQLARQRLHPATSQPPKP